MTFKFWSQNIKDPLQFSSVAQSYLTLCDPMNCSTPGLPVHHQLLGFTQTHVHRVGDAIQPSHPLLSPPPPAPNPSQHQNLFQWVNSSHEVAKVSVLPKNTGPSYHKEIRWYWWYWTGAEIGLKSTCFLKRMKYTLFWVLKFLLWTFENTCHCLNC